MDFEGSALRPVPAGQRRFGRYSLLYRIGTGGMANLYLGHYAGPDGFEKFVAIKRIHDHLAENPEFIRMFVDEARLAARISHPNVVQVLELGSVNGAYFIAMEYVDGESLNALLRRTEVPVELGACIISQAAEGLHAAHELRNLEGSLLNVVHRDVSPANLLISYQGAVKVVDFGVAKAKGNTAITGAGTVKGKFSYIAPEQIKPDPAAPLDRRADIFALGIVLFEITTRRRLFKGESDAAVTEMVLHHPIPRPSDLIPGYPKELEAIVLKALSRSQERRYQSAQEMHLALEEFLAKDHKRILPSNIAMVMQQIFADNIAEKATMMRNCQEIIASDPWMPEESYGSQPSLRELSGELAIGRKLGSKRQLLLAGVPLAAAVVVGLLLLVAQSRPAQQASEVPPTPVARPDARPALVRISIKTAPAEATIKLDGHEVQNPYVEKRSAQAAVAQVEVSAAGYKTRQLQIDLEEGGTLFVALEREIPAAVPANDEKRDKPRGAQPPRGHRPARPHKKKPVVKDLFRNPYEQ